jgi:hypothetical protein
MTTSPKLFDRRRFLATSGCLAIPMLARSQGIEDLVVENDLNKKDKPVKEDKDAESSLAESTGEASLDDAAPVLLPEPTVEIWRFGMILETPVTCLNCHATFPIPADWPEQKIEVAARSFDAGVQFEIRDLPGKLAKQVVLSIPRVVAGSTVNATVDLKITKSNLGLPKSTENLSVPVKLERDMRMFMGTSPNIDTNNGLIKKLSREFSDGASQDGWKFVEQIYDTVRDRVAYVEGAIRNASDALKDGKGDCEDMTSLFVAVCRNLRIPARMVWIPGHCYPEFYLLDAKGVGHWYPCQAAGSRQFGEMQETRPIIQKGDRFKVAEHNSPVRYLAETFRCDAKGKGKPRPSFLMEKAV